MPKLLSKETIGKIKLLRQRGYSLPEIKREVKASHGSIFRHIQGVKILPEYWKEWHGKQGGSIKRMKIREQIAEKKAKNSIYSLSDKEKMIFLTVLYWGEGSKSDFNLMNTDADLIKIFIKGLREVFNIAKDRFRISIRIYEDLDKQECLKYWSKITGVPAEKFINVDVLHGNKKGKLPYGMCRVRILKGGDMLKYIKALRKQIINLF
jgi:predicted DNA-binding protein YlxM (UPF0122 family)